MVWSPHEPTYGRRRPSRTPVERRMAAVERVGATTLVGRRAKKPDHSDKTEPDSSTTRQQLYLCALSFGFFPLLFFPLRSFDRSLFCTSLLWKRTAASASAAASPRVPPVIAARLTPERLEKPAPPAHPSTPAQPPCPSPVWPVTNGACCQPCAAGFPRQQDFCHKKEQHLPTQRIEVECFCKKSHKKKHHHHKKHHDSCPSSSSSSSSSSSCYVVPDSTSDSSSCTEIYKTYVHKKAADHHHHHHDKKKKKKHHDKHGCGNKIEIEIVIPSPVPAPCPDPCFPSSAQTCGIGCSALAAQLLALVSTPTPTAAAIATFVANATAYVACRTASGAALAPDVIALNALLTFLATLAPGTFPPTAQALALQAYQRLVEVCSNCFPCGQQRVCC
ncbi:hypothetical protein TW95_gp1702 [Pandoravirus inopinatum]|uniref:Uncharacterized protein n=1 Tax=Pandoravirus inopinatum TaxID=1605721 RepID=A0A0B5JBN1_9VIRU|nr:hypothetical protein TW95_gp1702 [Pandoravirus inopinatum]AJF98436.1 hypothetical protein [Pandoravirus inopinatum]